MTAEPCLSDVPQARDKTNFPGESFDQEDRCAICERHFMATPDMDHYPTHCCFSRCHASCLDTHYEWKATGTDCGHCPPQDIYEARRKRLMEEAISFWNRGHPPFIINNQRTAQVTNSSMDARAIGYGGKGKAPDNAKSNQLGQEMEIGFDPIQDQVAFLKNKPQAGPQQHH